MCFLLLLLLFLLIERFSSWHSLKLSTVVHLSPPPLCQSSPFLVAFPTVFQHGGCLRSWWGSQGHWPCSECSYYSRSSTVAPELSLSGRPASQSKALLQRLIPTAQNSCFQMLAFSSCSDLGDYACNKSIWSSLCIILLTFIIRIIGKTMSLDSNNSPPCLLSRMELWRLSHLILFYFT